jgi:hypothetical protein
VGWAAVAGLEVVVVAAVAGWAADSVVVGWEEVVADRLEMRRCLQG